MTFRSLFIKTETIRPRKPEPEAPLPAPVASPDLPTDLPDADLPAEPISAGNPEAVPVEELMPESFVEVSNPADASMVAPLESGSAVAAPEPSEIEPRVSEHVTSPAMEPLHVKSADERRGKHREERRSVMSGPRIPRHSSGWTAMLKHLKEEPNLRVLDFGPTSPNNINFLTGMGHSVYMADIVQEAVNRDWELPPPAEGEPAGIDEEQFFEQNLSFGDRHFDVVLLWTTIDYLPAAVIPPLIARLYEGMQPGGKLLAFFHTRSQGPETTFCRYHLVDSNDIDMQESGAYPVTHVYTNREIERLFKAFSGYKFFLARDNVYEVIITR
jgi:hypothetical protein